MANGTPRDDIGLDIKAGRPAISPEADALVQRVASLMSRAEAQSLYEDLYRRVLKSSSISDWVSPPYRFLSDFDAEAAKAIGVHLLALHDQLVRRAKQRGWEVDEGDA